MQGLAVETQHGNGRLAWLSENDIIIHWAQRAQNGQNVLKYPINGEDLGRYNGMLIACAIIFEEMMGSRIGRLVIGQMGHLSGSHC